MEFRDLRADEIEVRVSQVGEKGLSLLLYKDARCDMRILDETMGPENWQKRFYEHKGTLFCSVGIICNHWAGSKDPKTGEMKQFQAPEWVWKDDAGEPSNTSAQKGEASDAFKRACFNWGIGRALYSAPFIWIPSEKCRIKPGRNGKPACYDKFRVEKIKYDGERITGLSIWNDSTGHRCFVWTAPEADGAK